MSHISEQGKASLLRVAEWLESGAPHVVEETGEVVYGFEMATPAEQTGCGTVCCIAGAVVAFNPTVFPQYAKVDERIWWQSLASSIEHAEGDVFTDARNYLGMSESDAEALFEPDDMDQSASEGARVIRHYVETGKVTWVDKNQDEYSSCC